MAITGVDTFAVVVAGRVRALAWYRDVLGAPAAFVPEGVGHWIEMGPPRPQTRLRPCQTGHGSEPGPTGITLLTSDIVADFESLKARGVRFLSEPEKVDWGEWLCSFVDPDGNEFDLKQPATTQRDLLRQPS